MTITEWGTWSLYTPNTSPIQVGLGFQVVYCRRDTDQMDWYQFLQSNMLQANTVKMTVRQNASNNWIIQAVVREADRLFPTGCLLIEDDSIGDVNPQQHYGQLMYLSGNNNPYQSQPVPVPQVISRREFYQALAVQGQISNSDALAAVSTGTIPPVFNTAISSLPANEQFNAQMVLAGAPTFYRGNPLVALLGSGLGWSNTQIDALWTLAATL